MFFFVVFKKHLKISLDSKIDDKILRILPDITAH